MTCDHCKRVLARQHGAVLITGLIFMVVLLMIVMSVMRGVTLEERMASNARNRQLAIQAAEAVARDAESTLFRSVMAGEAPFGSPIDPYNATAFTAACTNGFCSLAAGVAVTLPKSFWDDASKTRSFASAGSQLTQLPSQPRYIVEQLGPTLVTFETPGPCPPILYRVTSRAEGMDSSVVFVETMFRHRPDKGEVSGGACG